MSYRILLVEWFDPDLKDKFKDLVGLEKNRKNIKERNLRIRYHKLGAKTAQENLVRLRTTLIGYDGGVKDRMKNRVSQRELNRIFSLIDLMPMGRIEKQRRDKLNRVKKKEAKNLELYSDRNPETTLKGTGFRNAEKARETIRLVEASGRGKVYQFQVINTMFFRAMYHPHRTKGMEEAMKVFSRWLKKYRESTK